MAKLHLHRADGTAYYYTERFEDGMVTRQIHPDGVVFLKRRGVQINEDIPPFAMGELVRRNWLVAPTDAAARPDVDWALDWDAIGDSPASTMRAAGIPPRPADNVNAFSSVMAAPGAADRQRTMLSWPWPVIAAILVMLLALGFGLSLGS